MIRLSISYSDRHLKTYELDDQSITVGRLPENTISIANMGISRRHFRIEADADRNYVITDLNSLNGIYLNNKRVKSATLAHGDVVSIGKYTVKFETVSSPEPREPSVTDTDLNFADEASEADRTAPVSSTDVMEVVNEQEQGDTGELKDTASATPALIDTSKHVVYKIDKPRMTLGSAESDDIFVSGFLVGDQHVVLENGPDGVWLRATKLMGWFKVNGHKTKSHRLEHKDRVEVGNSAFRYMQNG